MATVRPDASVKGVLNEFGVMLGSPMFTAAQLAHVLGRDKRGVYRVLRSSPVSGKILARGGQLADAWAIETLPANYRADLERLAKAKQFRDVPHLLSAGCVRWRPPMPMVEIARHHITNAVRVKGALARSIALYLNPLASPGQICTAACEDYQKEFGTVSERQVRRILDRVIERDGGEENFDDVALYLSDKLSKEKEDPAVIAGLLTPHEQSIHRYLAVVKVPSEPTVEELDLIWFSACSTLNEQIDGGANQKRARRAVIEFLDASPVRLSRTKAALKKLLKLKQARFIECAGDFNLMADQRAAKSGWKRSLVLSTEDKNLIVAHAALQKGGRLAPALRDLRESGKLCRELEEHHLAIPANKSYVPAAIRDQVQGDIRRLKNMVHGPRTHRLKGAYSTRDYSAMAAGDWFQADDVTLPCYYYEETESGVVRMRGQFLVMIDVRTDFVLGFLLISERNYDSLSIRSLITICAAKHGLPRRGFYFERGIWKSSAIIAGKVNTLPLEHADRGLRSLGMDLRHAQLPRAKVVERTIGQLQNRMEGFVGYVGRDERHDVRERVQRDFLDVESGRRPINESLLAKSQYCEELAKIIDDHNSEVQQGVRLNGMSPAEAWERLQGNRPRQGFDPKWRYVLARDVRKVKVGRNGITLRYGKKNFVYRDVETGKRVGDEVLAWFDPMLPDVLACTDLNRENVFSVERSYDVPAVDAPTEMLRQEMAKINDHQAYAKSLYWTSKNTLKAHHYAMTIADGPTLQIGSDIAAQRDRIAIRNEERKTRARVNRTVIESKKLPRALLASADAMPTETMQALGTFFSETENDK